MVRETRHLWVGNLPDNIREDRIREHFKRYGRVQNVKLLPRCSSGATEGGTCAAVAFMDIKSAAKAHNGEHVLDERELTTEYYEPAAIPSTASAGSSPAGSGYSASSGSVSSAPRYQEPRHTSGEEATSVAAAVGCAALAGGAAAAAAGAAAGSVSTWRGTNDSGAADYCRRGNTPGYNRYTRTPASTPVPAPYATPPSTIERTPHHRWYNNMSGSSGAPGTGDTSAPSTPGGAEAAPARRRRRSDSGAGSQGSSRSSSSSGEPSSDSRASTPTAGGTTSSHRLHPFNQWSSASGRPLAICVRNLPARSSDSSLKDGLYHEYKKHGKVAWVKIIGANAERYAVVRFKKPSDVEKALEVSQDKLFFGCKISVAPHQGCEMEDGEPARPYETDLDEYHPKATRTLFIGNLEKDVTIQQLRDKFKHFGRIIELDIKSISKQSGGAGYAFCQYASISSVVDAIRAMDGEYVGTSRVKLGFGKSLATTCVWIDGLTETTEKQVLGVVARCGAATSVCVDRSAGAALLHFEQAAAAALAVRELRRVAALALPPSTDDQRRLMVDFASRECQDAFYEQLEKHGGNGTAALANAERLPELSQRYTRHDSLSRYERSGSRSASYNRSSSRTPRYNTPSDHYDPADYPNDRRYRVYDEFGSSSPAEVEAMPGAAYEEVRSLQSVVVASPRRRTARHHRRRSRDSTPDELGKLRKERRSGGGRRSSGEMRHRSRSGSRSERHRRPSDVDRRRHRRRREESGSRAGTPLCDELPEGLAPAEPRRPPGPRDRSHLPMSLPLPKFAAHLPKFAIKSSPALPPPTTLAPAAPASPTRAPSATSSSEGSAPHSPSLEERIRSLDEKYEKWSGSRAAAAEAAERGRFKHRLLEIDIKEVKPSEVVRSLLAKRSVFDEDSERLEGASVFEKRPPSPGGSPRGKESRAPRALQYPFPTHPPGPSTPSEDPPEEERVPPNGTPVRSVNINEVKNRSDRLTDTVKSERITDTVKSERLIDTVKSEFKKSFVECSDSEDRFRTVEGPERPDGPRPSRTDSGHSLNRTDSVFSLSSALSLTEESKQRELTLEPVGRTRKPSTDKSHPDLDNKRLDKTDRDRTDHDRHLLQKNHENIPNEKQQREKEHQTVNSSEIPKPDTEKCAVKKTEQERLDKSIQRNSEPEKSTKISSVVRTNAEKDFDHLKDEQCSIDMERHIEEQLNLEKQQRLKEEPHLAKSGRTEEIIKEKLCSNMTKDKTKHDKIIETYREKLEKERLEKEKLEKEKADKERAEKEMLEQLKVELERKERARLEAEKQELERKQREKQEKERLEKEKAERERMDLEKKKAEKAAAEKERLEQERLKNEKEKVLQEKLEKEKKLKEDAEKEKIEKDKIEKEKHEKERLEKERVKIEREQEKLEKEKSERETEKEKQDKSNRHDSKKDKSDKEKRKEAHDLTEVDIFNHTSKSRKDDKHKHDRHRKDHSESRRESKKDTEKESKSRDISRKSSRDESSREMQRKDSSDSTASRNSHDSTKNKEEPDAKEEKHPSSRHKHLHEHNHKHKSEKETSPRTTDSRKVDEKHHEKIKDREPKSHESKPHETKVHESKIHEHKEKPESHEKQRHYSLDSQHVETKRKERLNSTTSLPSNIGLKRRMSSQESLDSVTDEAKKAKISERRDSKDSKPNDKPKTPKFNKNHFAKLLESKIKDDKKNQVKPPDEPFKIEWKESTSSKENKVHSNDKIRAGKSPKNTHEEKSIASQIDNKIENDVIQETPFRDLDFLATLELRSSEEDEKQKALRKEMKEKKRIQQLQQIQELQMQQDAMQQGDKIKDDKRIKNDEKRKDVAREKRMSTERKSREDPKIENKKKTRKPGHSSDTSDSDEPKKHSIFDIVDEGPTYISMYDKVKARSCKNMQKQEEEKRQEKIKAKFSQLKQSRAKREEKKRSTSWDGDTDSDHEDKKYLQKHSMVSSSEDERQGSQHHRRENITDSENDYEAIRRMDKLRTYNDSTNDEDPRNKLTRKNSRSRIMSDTSDDDSFKRSISKSFRNHVEIKKEVMSDTESQSTDYFPKKNREFKKEFDIIKRDDDEKFSKDTLINLFKFDSLDDKKLVKTEFSKIETDEKKIKSELSKFEALEDKKAITEHNMKPTMCATVKLDDFRLNQLKSLCNDFSSEGELSSRYAPTEIRKKHKKKQKKQKTSLSEDDNKSTDYSEQSPVLSGGVRHRRNSEKLRKHSNKKEKRKEKIRDSVDSEDFREDKTKAKKWKKCTVVGFDNKMDSGAIRREEKMEDIFGPLSDESDTGRNYNATNNLPGSVMSNDKYNYMMQVKEKEESRRRKDRKRKEKRFIARDDDNSLDVDAAGKAIEASLFADSVPENDNQNARTGPLENCVKSDQDVFRFTDGDEHLESSLMNIELKQAAEQLRKDSKEKKRKKKKNKEDRQNRKDQHHHHDKSDKIERYLDDSNTLVDVPIAVKEIEILSKPESDNSSTLVCKPAMPSPSLPRLTDSPPLVTAEVSEPSHPAPISSPTQSMEVLDRTSSNEDVRDIDLNTLKHVKSEDLTSVPSQPQEKPIPGPEKFIPGFGSEVAENISESAVKSISEFDKPKEPSSPSQKLDEKEEKPRAVISQEETEDAVAALLGESFGQNDDTFNFNEVEDTPSQVESTSMESRNLLEEDAEEMRQAVQNLNASELELKPDTPLSENDLQIDTDNEESEDITAENIDKTISTISVTTSTPTVIESKKYQLHITPTVINVSTVAKNNTDKLNPLILPSVANIPKLKDIQSDQTQVSVLPIKRDSTIQQITSTATPVISTGWTISGSKLREPHLINVHANHSNSRDVKPPQSSNIVQLKSPITQGLTLNTRRPLMATQARMNPPYIINQMIRPGHVADLQPPTIKIPEQHIMYQNKSGIVISPRMANEVRLQSPKSSPHSDMSSPRLTILSPTSQNKLSPHSDMSSPRMTIVSPTPQNMGMVSPNSLQQRSPGHVTVVRMQQPPLSPIQTMHLPHGNRTMVSPNTRPNSVLVQTQHSPIHLNRLPVAPILAPLSKTIHPNNILQQQKNMGINTNTIPTSNANLIHSQKLLSEIRKNDHRAVQEMMDNSKIMMSPSSSLQQNTVMAQNRLIMQNQINLNLQLANNKVLFNNTAALSEKREYPFKSEVSKSEPTNKPTYGQSPIIHIASVSQSSSPGVHTGLKPLISIGQEHFSTNRPHISNIVHNMNTQRLLTTVPITSVIQGETMQSQSSSVLTMAPNRPATVLTRLDTSTVSVTSSVLNNSVMTPSLVKTNVSHVNSRPITSIPPLTNTLPEAKKYQDFESKPVALEYSDSPLVKHDNLLKTEVKPSQTIPQRGHMDLFKETHSNVIKSPGHSAVSTQPLNKLPTLSSVNVPQTLNKLSPVSSLQSLNKVSAVGVPQPLNKTPIVSSVSVSHPLNKITALSAVSVSQSLNKLPTLSAVNEPQPLNESHTLSSGSVPQMLNKTLTPPCVSVAQPLNKTPTSTAISVPQLLNKTLIQPVVSAVQLLNKMPALSATSGPQLLNKTPIPPAVSVAQLLNETPTLPAVSVPQILDKTPVQPVVSVGKPSNKCETDYEELLKDNTNEIKVTKDPERKVEVNVTVNESIISYTKNKPEGEVNKQDNIEPYFGNMIPVKSQENPTKPDLLDDIRDEGDGWSAKEINIESVIKKVEDLCNSHDTFEEDTEVTKSKHTEQTNIRPDIEMNETDQSKLMEVQIDPLAEVSDLEKTSMSKRGGRTTRGRKTDKQDRVQTRQISKPARGTPASRRGRGGRAKTDKKIKATGQNSNLPGDIYDFHDDSGDDTETSQNKNDSRPRLILTIKSPLTEPATVCNVPVSSALSLSITPKEQPQITEKPNVDGINKETGEDFLAPASNTRKSRRLQEKGTPVDYTKEPPLRGPGKEGIKRNNRQAGTKSLTTDKAGLDVRKSPRGEKRTRNRSSSDTSIDSSDEKSKKDDLSPPEHKIPKLAELTSTVPDKTVVATAATPVQAMVTVTTSTLAQPVTSTDTTTSAKPITTLASPVMAAVSITAPPVSTALIMKPPKKMISEISAKLASVYEAAASAKDLIGMETATGNERIIHDSPDGKHVSNALFDKLIAPSESVKTPQMPDEDMRPLTIAETPMNTPSVEIGIQRLPTPMIWPGVDDADARVQSPALPNRPPAIHRLGDRATPILIRACDSEASPALEACRASPAQAGAVGAAGPGGRPAGQYRVQYSASLPRGAHHPPPPALHPTPHPAITPHHHLKHVAIVGPQPTASASRITHTSVPSVSPQAPVALGGDAMYPPHFSHQHYQVFQQHFRATQHESRATPSPYTRSPLEEGSEAPTLELRRPPSARVPPPVPRPAHSPSPGDRLISTHQMVGGGRGSPPPAHGGANVSRLPAALPPPGPAGPPHASQVPREADSLQMLLRRYPVMWQGLLALKNDAAAVQMHFVHGNPAVAGHTLRRHVDGSTPPLRVAQRMRLEPVQLQAVHRKMQMENEHCMLLALPCGRDHMDVLQQSTNLTSGFISYLQRKQAAGIVNVAPPGSHLAMYTVHIFPSCDFANENLARIAPDLLHRVADIAHLLIVIATV